MQRPDPVGRLAGGGLVLAVVVGVALRCWRLGWGLDQGLQSIDEWAWATWLRPFARFGLDAFATNELIYPTAYRFLAGICTAAGLALGLIPPPPPDATPWMGAIAAARVAAVLASCVAIFATWRGARLLGGPRAGAIAAACLAVLPFDVMQVHYASVDPLVACMTACTLWCALRLAASGRARDACLGGVSAGLAFAAKYSGLAALVPLAWATLEAARRVRRWQALVALGVLAGAGVLAGVALGCPACVLRPDWMFSAMAAHRFNATDRAPDFWNNFLAPTLGWWGRRWLYQLVAALPYTLGVALWLAAAAGVVRAGRDRTAGDRVVLVFAAVYLGVVGASRVTLPRYLLPLFPALAMLAGRGLASLRWWRAATAVVLVYSAALAATQVARFSWDGSTTVVDWIVRHPPPSAGGAPARVAFPGHVDSFHLPRLLAERGLVPLARLEASWTSGAPDVVVMPQWHATHVRRDSPGGAAAAALAALERGAAGYRAVAEFPARRSLQHWLDVRLDPAFAGDLWQGDPGFVVYYRDAPPAP